MNVALIGYGYWGPNLARNVVQNSPFDLLYVCDQDTERLNLLKKNYPFVNVSKNYKEVILDNNVDCVIVATNPASHYEISKLALENNKHVLVEKPMATNLEHAEDLINLANRKNLTLMVDHTFLYNGVVKSMKEIVDSGNFGSVNYIDSTRINLGIFQNDVNVLWDLASHDLSVINYLLKEKLLAVAATGKCHFKKNIENIAYMTLFYENDIIVHIHSSWMSPVKIRKMLIGGEKQMLVFDDIEPTEKLKVYDSSYTLKEKDKEQVLIDYRVGDVYIPKYDTKEPLASMIQDFCKAVTEKTIPLSDSDSAIFNIKALCAAETSLRNNGNAVEL